MKLFSKVTGLVFTGLLMIYSIVFEWDKANVAINYTLIILMIITLFIIFNLGLLSSKNIFFSFLRKNIFIGIIFFLFLTGAIYLSEYFLGVYLFNLFLLIGLSHK
ncbi:hypothetical protein OO013_19285 [Mangrovivirga sp. M17]|uniref:Uncharacterized protein n=1 Tax=Mangrovivirga halotolerans TaxID=2993936 RepID=A0ABT3RXU6_9BACT|nr:hypothetical protein [Mangrovivirga halotolerans]MCX2746032.1 hypothetical protein [Mangrovivirga halotolerans]